MSQRLLDHFQGRRETGYTNLPQFPHPMSGLHEAGPRPAPPRRLRAKVVLPLPVACLHNDVWERTFFYGPFPWFFGWGGMVALRGERARWHGWI